MEFFLFFIFVAFLLYVFLKKSSSTNKQRKKYTSKTSFNPLKDKGDKYEKFIGSKFEDKGNLVIYNGFIKGYKDKGIDVISISNIDKTINLIQCKNWTKKPLLLDDIKKIYTKLDNYNLDFVYLNTHDINTYLVNKKDIKIIENLLFDIKQNYNKYTIRKTLYLGSDKVIDLNIGEHLQMLKSNIFKYYDMKIVIKKLII